MRTIPLKNFFELLDKEQRNDYIVRLAYKYKYEHDWTVENQYLEYDGNNDCYVWLHDWDEGQEDALVLGYICIDDVFCLPKALHAIHVNSVYGATSIDFNKEDNDNVK